MKKLIIPAIFLGLVALLLPELAQASGEDQALGFLERVLNVIADFFDKIFKSLADAVRSLWSDESANQ